MPRLTSLTAFALALIPALAQAQDTAPADGFCIRNASAKAHVFAAETREGDRQVAKLAPGEMLCASASSAADGVVSVFESFDSFEGCSRIVPLGKIEEMHAFAEFDRCVWSAHGG